MVSFRKGFENSKEEPERAAAAAMITKNISKSECYSSETTKKEEAPPQVPFTHD